MCSVVFVGGFITKHRDGIPSGVRHHLVVQTNPDAWVYHDGQWQQCEQNGIYTMNPNCFHAAVNMGQKPRTHFVVDIKR